MSVTWRPLSFACIKNNSLSFRSVFTLWFEKLWVSIRPSEFHLLTGNLHRYFNKQEELVPQLSIYLSTTAKYNYPKCQNYLLPFYAQYLINNHAAFYWSWYWLGRSLLASFHRSRQGCICCGGWISSLSILTSCKPCELQEWLTCSWVQYSHECYGSNQPLPVSRDCSTEGNICLVLQTRNPCCWDHRPNGWSRILLV